MADIKFSMGSLDVLANEEKNQTKNGYGLKEKSWEAIQQKVSCTYWEIRC